MNDAPVLACPHCGTKNRVPRAKLEAGLKPVCGNCKLPLAGVLTVTDSSFAAIVEGASMPVLLDAWAPWCGPCRAIAPMVEEIAQEQFGRAVIAKLNVDDNPRVSSRFQIQSIPTLLIFRGGLEVDRLVGGQPKAEILRRLALHT